MKPSTAYIKGGEVAGYNSPETQTESREILLTLNHMM